MEAVRRGIWNHKGTIKNNLNEWGKSFKSQCRVVGGLCTASIISLFTNVGYCSGDETTKKVLGEILNVLCSVFLYVGVLLICWGVGQLVLAFKNEDADSKSKAIMLIVASAFLIGIKPMLQSVLNATGAGVTIGG